MDKAGTPRTSHSARASDDLAGPVVLTSFYGFYRYRIHTGGENSGIMATKPLRARTYETSPC